MKYVKLGYAMETQITTDYTVRANICRIDTDMYQFTLELSHKSIGQYHMLNDDEVFQITSVNPNLDVAEYVQTLYQESYFAPHIQRYEYWITCMTIGNEVLEHYSPAQTAL